jgi:hypothetical protein
LKCFKKVLRGVERNNKNEREMEGKRERAKNRTYFFEVLTA